MNENNINADQNTNDNVQTFNSQSQLTSNYYAQPNEFQSGDLNNKNNGSNKNNKGLLIILITVIAVVIICVILFFILKSNNNKNINADNKTNNTKQVEQIVYYNNEKNKSKDFLSLVLLGYDYNVRYVVTINEDNIAKNLIDTKEYFGNEIFKVSLMGNKPLVGDTRFSLNKNNCNLSLVKEIDDSDSIIRENEKLVMTYNASWKNYHYYFAIDNYYIEIILLSKTPNLSETYALDFFNYLNEKIKVQKVMVDKSLVLNEYLLNTTFLSDELLDNLREKGFNIKNSLGIQDFSKMENSLIDYSIYYNTKIPNYEKIYCDINEVNENIYDNYSEKADDAFDVNNIKVQSNRSHSNYSAPVAIKNNEKYYILDFRAYNSENQNTAFNKETLKKVVTDFLTIK